MAASVPLSRSTLRSLTSVSSRFAAPRPQGGPRFISFARNPSWRRASASMSLEAPEKATNISFLDRKESGFLHFVKYQGLGNDSILVDNRDSLEPRVTPEHTPYYSIPHGNS